MTLPTAKHSSRPSREQETREVEEGYDTYLEDLFDDDMLSMKNIPTRPGFQRRWIRTHTLGVEDQQNLFRRHNGGWRPVLLESIPKGQSVVSVEFGGHTVVGIKGSVLMERPDQVHAREKFKVAMHAANQLEAVKNNMFSVVKDPKMEKPPEVTLNRQSTTGRDTRALIDEE